MSHQDKRTPPTPKHHPLFIIGMNRSGTTLLSLIMDSHSKIAIPYESHFFVKYHKNRSEYGELSEQKQREHLLRAILSEPYVKQWDYTPRIDELDLDRCSSIESAIDEVYSAYARFHGKSIWGDKTPRYIDHIEVLNKMFPDARYIHLIRDGRDVSLSILKQWWGPNDFVTAMTKWKESVSIARRMLNMLPDDRQIELRFEDFVADPEHEIQRLMSFLGLDYEPPMLNLYRHQAAAKVGDRINAHHRHLLDDISMNQAYKWKSHLSKADQAIAYAIAGDLLSDLKYPEGEIKNFLSKPKKIFYAIRRRWTRANA